MWLTQTITHIKAGLKEFFEDTKMGRWNERKEKRHDEDEFENEGVGAKTRETTRKVLFPKEPNLTVMSLNYSLPLETTSLSLCSFVGGTEIPSRTDPQLGVRDRPRTQLVVQPLLAW